jgi:hypothetical protein
MESVVFCESVSAVLPVSVLQFHVLRVEYGFEVTD